MLYCKGFKYQLKQDILISTGITISDEILDSFITLGVNGELSIRKGYAWDGASGPTIDGEKNMVPSIVHDALYELMRKCLLHIRFRKQVDKLFYKMCLDRGMNKYRAKVYFWAVRRFGKFTSRSQDKRKVLYAP